MDITKCSGKNCNLKDTCYRYKSESKDEIIPPIKDGKCDMYWGDGANNLLNNIKEILNGKL